MTGHWEGWLSEDWGGMTGMERELVKSSEIKGEREEEQMWSREEEWVSFTLYTLPYFTLHLFHMSLHLSNPVTPSPTPFLPLHQCTYHIPLPLPSCILYR